MSYIERDYTPAFGDGPMTAMALVMMVVLMFGAWWFIGEPRQERADCLQWQSQAAAYPSFYLTEWQKQQCDEWKIIVNAPVK